MCKGGRVEGGEGGVARGVCEREGCLVPNAKEGVPRASGHCHSVLGDAEA